MQRPHIRLVLNHASEFADSVINVVLGRMGFCDVAVDGHSFDEREFEICTAHEDKRCERLARRRNYIRPVNVGSLYAATGFFDQRALAACIPLIELKPLGLSDWAL